MSDKDQNSFSVIIPARNEQAYLGECLDSIDAAEREYPHAAQRILVLNRCTDATERIARDRGATIARCDTPNLAAIRNAGARHATGSILITLDADSRMSTHALGEVHRALASGKYVGGGVPIIPDRKSVGILLTGVVIMSLCRALGVPSAGMFWCYFRDFEAIGGFDESCHAAEDIDFARRLKAYGRETGRRYGTLSRAPILTSARKFDEFGDWFALKLILSNPRRAWIGLQGRQKAMADRYWYDVER